MKMTFQIKHTDRKLFGSSFLKILIIALIILIFVLGFSIFNSTQSFLSNLFSPFLKSGDYFYQTINQIAKTFSDKNQIIKENDNLLIQIENDRINLFDYDSIKHENQKLREDLKIKPVGDFISASVIAKSPQIPLDSLFLDKGIKDGLNDGDLVLTGERILIGKIVKVSKNRSTVALNSFVDTLSYGSVARTNESLEIKGVGGGNIEAKVPFDFDIVVGDKIMVTGSVEFLTALVGSIEEDRSAGFKKVLMSLPLNISKINTVFVAPTINE